MSDRCTKLRITQKGGIAGTVLLVDLARSGLNEAQSRSMDEACRQLFTLASLNAEEKKGADIPLYHVEIEEKSGETRSLEIPYRRHQDSGLEGADIDAIIEHLRSISPSHR